MTRRREAVEWLVALVIIGGVLATLGYLTFQEDRAERSGFLAGIGWRPLQSAVLTMLIFALFALGLNLQFGFTGLINFGHVAFLGVGAYTAALLTWGEARIFGVQFGFSDVGEASWGAALGMILLIVVVASAIAIGFALLLGIPTLKLREDYLAIVTIGAAEILRIVFLNETELTNGPIGLRVEMPGADHFTDRDGAWYGFFDNLRDTRGIQIDPYYAFLILAVLGALIVLFVVFELLARSPWGRVVKAIREDEDVAASLGKNVYVYKMQSLILGSVVAAIAGILYAWFQRHISPDSFLPIVTFYAWIILVLGGVGNHKGVIVGAFLLWGLFEGARNVESLPIPGLQDTGGPVRLVLIGVLLIVIMMFRPQGAMGRREEMLFGK